MLSSVSVPPSARGLMWSRITARVWNPCAAQARQSGSWKKSALRFAWSLRPRMRFGFWCWLPHAGLL